MSQSDRKLPLADAVKVACRIIDMIAPACDRIEVAGSVRRRKPEVGDIEIVAIAARDHDLFGEPRGSRLDPVLDRLAREGVLSPIRGGERYKQFVVPDAGCKLDLFLCDPATWGVIFTLRTGSAGFSHQLVTQRDRRTSSGRPGLLPVDCRVQDGRVWRGEQALETPEEADVFRVAGLDWIEPEERS